MPLLIKEVHPSLISSKYLAKALQHNNPSHGVVISSSGIRDVKQIHQSWFLCCVALYLPSGILLPLIMEPPSSSFIQKLFLIQNLFYLITVSFKLLPHKQHRKKQTFLGPTGLSIPNSGHPFVILSFPIVRVQD